MFHSLLEDWVFWSLCVLWVWEGFRKLLVFAGLSEQLLQNSKPKTTGRSQVSSPAWVATDWARGWRGSGFGCLLSLYGESGDQGWVREESGDGLAGRHKENFGGENQWAEILSDSLGRRREVY